MSPRTGTTIVIVLLGVLAAASFVQPILLDIAWTAQATLHAPDDESAQPADDQPAEDPGDRKSDEPEGAALICCDLWDGASRTVAPPVVLTAVLRHIPKTYQPFATRIATDVAEWFGRPINSQSWGQEAHWPCDPPVIS
jgi:hypothetical protein